VTFVYRFDSENAPPVALKLKVETKHARAFFCIRLQRDSLQGLVTLFEGAYDIHTYELDELLGTKCALSTSARRVGTCSTCQLR
jgi:hypothetical protein